MYYYNFDFIYLIYFSLREEFSMVEREYSRMPKQEVNSQVINPSRKMD